jgi:hypothetical protein
MLIASSSEDHVGGFPPRLLGGLTAAGPFCDELLRFRDFSALTQLLLVIEGGTCRLLGLEPTCPAKRNGTDHVDASSDCLVSFHDDQCGRLRSRHRLGFDESHTRRARVRSDSSCYCSELYGQCADGLVHSSHSAGAISEESFSIAIPDRFRSAAAGPKATKILPPLGGFMRARTNGHN